MMQMRMRTPARRHTNEHNVFPPGAAGPDAATGTARVRCTHEPNQTKPNRRTDSDATVPYRTILIDSIECVFASVSHHMPNNPFPTTLGPIDGVGVTI
mmetsp:Transcript_5753/g.13380  ORF Transcript_5753/g.13380 Transcript_5753/m.13380 type:complete len:98 (-) Transcript_5753:18-311(-)